MIKPRIDWRDGVPMMLVVMWAAGFSLALKCFGGPTSAPATLRWEDTGKRVKVQYPADWKMVTDPDYELMLIPPGESTKKRRITFDVPDLPPHLAFMIQMARVERGYIDDLKKEHPDLLVNNAADAQVNACKARLIRSTWHKEKQTFKDVALLMIHDGDVYILDAQTGEANLPATRAAFDLIEASIEWKKR